MSLDLVVSEKRNGAGTKPGANIAFEFNVTHLSVNKTERPYFKPAGINLRGSELVPEIFQ